MRKLAILAAVAAAVSTASAGISVNLDFLWKPDPKNDSQVYLHVANTAYQPPAEQVRAVYPQMKAPELDFPILLFMANEAHVSLSAVWDLRSKGTPWVQVMTRLNVPPDRVFVPVQHDPGPPYGKAYGHWKNHPKEQVALTDSDVAYWVNVRTQARYFSVPPDTVVGWRQAGPTWKSVAGTQYRGKHGGDDQGEGHGHGDGDDQGENHGHGKGKGKGKG
ncbi:MAG: hypothetical protein HY049_00940 [Acidobacteria bacterium]|nr:hypothetical protein [Acidobacteriota bacterium]